ncbi:MAG TPA: YceI family protein [Pyrinomonadaceae bacterium]|nr:YceI family protein [Pyrinomonadaceae bacterium]
MGESENNLVRYRLVAGESRFAVQAFAAGMLHAFGHDPVIEIRDFEGEVEFEPETLARARLEVRVNPAALGVGGEVKEKDRLEIERMMHEDVLESAQYPLIVFKSGNVTAARLGKGRYRVRAIGDLTMHGVTQNNLWIHGEATLSDDRLRAQGEFTLKQTDFKLKLVSVAGGALKVKDELKFTFDLAGRKSEAEGEGSKDEGEAVQAK